VARNWAGLFVLVIVIDTLLRMMGVVGFLGAAGREGAGGSLLILTLAPLAVAGLMAWRDEAESRSGFTPGLFALVEGALIVAAAVLLLRAWGVDPFAPPVPGAGPLALVLPGLVEATMIVVVGVAIARAVLALLGGGAESEAGALVDEENVGGASRIDTVLPILRGFALGAIVVVTTLMALSATGINIAPLLAGAGVLGLALGFGAQKLVGDVISGLFYLYEDAFRSGEYIETKSGKGVVEKIGLRSVRLRHHRGPVFTIPFSDMGTIQNHSRDWVKIKFTFLVPSDTDVEMVRKLVKKVGEQLVEDPELQDKFLEPLKSQGAIGIQGRAYVIGCKFTSRPGKQFLIRRKAYAALQKALAEKGIELFAPQLTLAADEQGGGLVPAGPDGRPMPTAAQ
jgi:small-conductance mechanosensitive channel